MTARSQQAALLDALTHGADLVQRVLDRAAVDYGVSPAQARLLRALAEGAPTIGELATRLALDKSSTSGLVDRAEARGLVRRVPSQLDRRSVRVRLTVAGGAVAADIAALVATELEQLLEPLSPGDRDTLAAALTRLSGR